jgi:GNAT superfamily N-acetyltransferase
MADSGAGAVKRDSLTASPAISRPASTVPEERFEMRGLRNQDEVVPWGALCGAGFSHRPGDPDRFRKKYNYDPTASLELTRVAVPIGEDTRMAGTVRLFRRKWNTGTKGETCGMVGLGEVCTHPDFRGKGIASLLMKDAYVWCEKAAEAAHAEAVAAGETPLPYISTLHAAASVGPLYQKYGFSSLHSIAYGRLALADAFAASGSEDIKGTHGAMGLTASPATVEEGFDWSANWEQLQAAHSSMCSHLELVGTTVRDKEYWLRWMPNVTGNRMVVFMDKDDKSKILAYAAFARKNDHYRLSDAGMSKEVASNPEAAAFVLESAALYAVQADLKEGKIPSAEAVKDDAACVSGAAIPSVLVSLAVHDASGSSGLFSVNHAAFTDEGWMGKPLLNETTGVADKASPGEEAVARLKEAAEKGKFIVFLADSF